MDQPTCPTHGVDSRCVFLEMEPWERDFIQAHCKACDQFRAYDRELDESLAAEIADAHVLSVFIYSQMTAEANFGMSQNAACPIGTADLAEIAAAVVALPKQETTP